MYKLRALLIGLATIALVAGHAAQPAAADDGMRLRITQVDASAFPDVRVIASITDAQDRPVADLSAKDVVVSEDGRTQSAGADLATEFAPLAIGLVLDTSGSMAGRPIADAKAAMTQLISTLGPKDQASVITFNTRATVEQSLTTDKDALVAATGRAVAGGNTAIFDAVATTIDALGNAPAQARRAVILLTDGIDNSSAIARQTIVDRIRAQGYPIYVIGLGTDLDRATLQALAEASTAGQLFVAPTSAQLGSIYSSLSQRIATQYLVAYHSNVRSVAEGTTMTLTLQVVRAGTVLATGSTTFVVPAGHGVTAAAPATAEPAPALLPSPQPLAGPYSPEVVGLLGTASVLSLLLWLFGILTTQSLYALERRRVGEVSAEYTVDPFADRKRTRSFRDRVVLPFLAGIGHRFGRFTTGSLAARVELRLAQAGRPLNLGPAEFIGLQLAAAFTGGALFALLGIFIVGLDLGWVLLISFAGVLIGLLIPSIWLDRGVKARRRAILRALPAALDMLALSARAGLTFDGAIAQVVQRWESPLSDEFRQVLAEFRIGRDRRDTLRAMATRTGVQDVTRFANAVIQADSLGVPISKVLLDQAVEMRTRRRQRAEESARIAPVKMLFPMVGLIFPALFVVILGPAVPRFLDLFKSY